MFSIRSFQWIKFKTTGAATLVTQALFCMHSMFTVQIFINQLGFLLRVFLDHVKVFDEMAEIIVLAEVSPADEVEMSDEVSDDQKIPVTVNRGVGRTQ